jgi:hypothetical protein
VPTSLLETFLMMCRSTSALSLLVWIHFFPKCWITVIVGLAQDIFSLSQVRTFTGDFITGGSTWVEFRESGYFRQIFFWGEEKKSPGDWIVSTSLLETFLMMCRSTSTLSLLVWIHFFPKCWITVTVGLDQDIFALSQVRTFTGDFITGGSTWVEFRESGYFRQIIGNYWMFSVYRRSSVEAWSGWQCFLHIIPQRLVRCVWTFSCVWPHVWITTVQSRVRSQWYRKTTVVHFHDTCVTL